MKIVVDLQSAGRDHIPFNTGFLKILRRCAGTEPVTLICRDDHRNALAGLLREEDISHVRLPDNLHGAPPGRLVAHDERAHLRFIRDQCQRLGADHLILLGVRADLLERLRRRPPPIRVDIVFHASLAEPARWRSRNPFRRLFDMFGVLGRCFPPNVQLIFLEEGIADQVRPLLAPGIRTAVLPHPIPAVAPTWQRQIDPGAIHIGFLGENAIGKGFEHFIALAEQRPAHIRLNCVGRRGPHHDPHVDRLFDTPPASEKMDQAMFDARVRANDLIFLPLDPDWYNLVASGTLLDCIRHGVPPVVVRNASVSCLEQRYGAFGYIVASPAEGIALILAKTPAEFAEDLPRFRRVLHAIALDRSVAAIAERCCPIFSPPR